MKILEAGEVKAFAETFLSDIFLRGAVRAVLDAAPEYKPKPAWIPVEERLPATKAVKEECGAGEVLEWEESGECLCYTVFESVRVCRFYKDSNSTYWLDAQDKSCDVTSEVTHWMERPDGPEGER